jgi:hypothetical protein
MTPLDRIPTAVLESQQSYVAGAPGPIARLWRSLVAARRCERIVEAQSARTSAWRSLHRAQRLLRRAVRGAR